MKRNIRALLAPTLTLLLAFAAAPPLQAKAKKAKVAAVQHDEPAASESGDAFSDGAGEPGSYQLRTLLQTRFQHTAADMEPIESRLLAEGSNGVDYTQNLIRERALSNDGFGIQRAFLRATAQPTKEFGAKLLVDFAELLHKNQKSSLKLAYGELRVTRAITVTAGLFKIPFSLLELLPIADYEFADVGPTDALIKDVGVGGRDIGVKVQIAPLHKRRALSFELAAFDGDNHNLQRYPGPGILAARVKTRPWSHLELAGDCAYRPMNVRDVDDNGTAFQKHAKGGACSVDASFSYHRFAVRGEWMTGKRTDSPLFPDKKDHRFSALWGLASYRVKLRDKMALMPAVRVEWLDEDQPSVVGQTFLVSAGVNLDVSSSTRLLLDLSRSRVQGGTKDRNDVVQLYRPSTTTGVVQVQFKL
ncbi:MAG: porin [Polyangiaceae bacterium]